MSESNANPADAVFSELDAAKGAPMRLFPALAAAEPQADATAVARLQQAYAGMLAYAAYAGFPADARRWEAAALLMSVAPAGAAPGGGGADQRLAEAAAAVEDEILGAEHAPASAVEAAFRRRWRRAEAAAADAGERAGLAALFETVQARLAGSRLVFEAARGVVALLERLDERAELRCWLERLAGSDEARVAELAQGRLRVLEAREAPLALAFEDIDGKTVTLPSPGGEVVLLQFWASWCGPCRGEIPHLRAAHAAYAGRGLRIVGVSLDATGEDEDPAQARARVAGFMRDNQMDWPTQFDGSRWANPIGRRFGVTSIPASLLLDRQGRVAAINLRGDDIAVQVEKLLA